MIEEGFRRYTMKGKIYTDFKRTLRIQVSTVVVVLNDDDRKTSIKSLTLVLFGKKLMNEVKLFSLTVNRIISELALLLVYRPKLKSYLLRLPVR
jgi:hypothetical protein